MDSKKETVICVYSVNTNHILSLIDKINKEEAPFYYKLYYMPVINEEAISKCIKYIQEEGKDCLLSFSETSSYVCAVINERLGYPSPSPLSNVICRNKYQTHVLVSESEWCYGFNLNDPVDLVVQNVKTFPCMLKPTMLCSGKGMFRCDDEASLRSKLQDINAYRDTIESIQAPQSEVIPTSGEIVVGKSVQYMVEEFIETNGTGVCQYYMEVFVTKEGKVLPYSLAEVFLFQNGMFLGTVIPPIHLVGGVKPFEDYANHIGDKLYDTGFKNQGFTIEFWRFPDGKFRLCEINPRVSPECVYIDELYSCRNIFNDVTNLFLHNKEPTYTPLSILMDSLAANKHEEEYTLLIDFSSKGTGLVSSILNYDLLEELSEKGYAIMFYVDRGYVLTEASATILGKLIASVTIKGTWNEVVKEEKLLREKLYMGLPQYSRCFEYPKYFTEK